MAADATSSCEGDSAKQICMWSESYSANIDIQGRLNDILQLFNNCLKNYFNPKWKKVQSLSTLTTSNAEQNAEQNVDPTVFLIMNRQLRI